MATHLFIQVQTRRIDWLEEATNELIGKINFFMKMERRLIKSSSMSRAQSQEKVRDEAGKILKSLKPNDLVIVFDETGKSHGNSVDFSKDLVTKIESSSQRLAFVIGGAFGLGEEIKLRANVQWRLSNLTMNHHLASLMALEQLYRGLTIWKGKTYHN